jgi:glycosyltransferase involved in cell wall biosynthesis
MTSTELAGQARVALAQRLRQVAEVLLTDAEVPAAEADPARDSAVLLDRLVRSIAVNGRIDEVWLLLVALSGALPTEDEVRAAARHLELAGAVDATLWLLETALANGAGPAGGPTRNLEVVNGGVVVDVDHSAQYDLHTGIQAVVRSTLPLWMRDHDVVPVAWTPGYGSYRALTAAEGERAIGRTTPADTDDTAATAEAAVADLPLTVPWHGTLILAEVPPLEACARLSALAQFSGSRVAAIGYDCIPIVSADLVPIVEPNRFGRYLAMIKYAHVVAGISASATAEFQGFAHMLPTQGLVGPAVSECILPDEGLAAVGGPARAVNTDVPIVLSVGSFEPRKNHLALIYAAERLWRDGLRFQLRMIGGSGWGTEVPRVVKQLQANGRPLTMERGVDRADLIAAYQQARFTVFASLHEGYGLPVAESLALGVPVITSNFGSTAEIAQGRGGVLIDPRDDDALVDAIRIMLTDETIYQGIRSMIPGHQVRTWEEYASELWALAMTPAVTRERV